MKFLVDANVMSELTKPSPDSRAITWLRDHARDLAIDPIILSELRFGILLLPAGRRRAGLERWFDSGVQRLHCLPWEPATGFRWADLLARLRRAGKVMPIKDSLIAATALRYDLIVVTPTAPTSRSLACAFSIPSSVEPCPFSLIDFAARGHVTRVGAQRTQVGQVAG